MTVGELIDKLSEFDSTRKVFVGTLNVTLGEALWVVDSGDYVEIESDYE